MCLHVDIKDSDLADAQADLSLDLKFWTRDARADSVEQDQTVPFCQIVEILGWLYL